MNHIYAQAQFTIIGGSGDAWSGLPGVSSNPRRAQESLHLGDVKLVSIPLLKYPSLHLPWATRAWTFQEGCLSWRRIIFYEEEVVYLCEQSCYLESIAQIPPPWPGESRNAISDYQARGIIPSVYIFSSSGASVDDAARLVQAYSGRVLSFSEDALLACLGILNAAKVTHYWDVPIAPSEMDPSCVLMSLCWWNTGSREQRCGFPSWSWTRWTGQKCFSMINRQPSIQIEIQLNESRWIDVSLIDVFHGNIGDVSSGKTLRLTGTTLSPRFTVHEGRYYTTIRTTQGQELRFETFMDREDISLDDLQDAMMIIYEDLAKTNLEGRKPKDVFLGGSALVVIPYKEAFLRIGIADKTGHSFEEIKCSDEEGLEEGVLTLADATRRTIYLE